MSMLSSDLNCLSLVGVAGYEGPLGHGRDAKTLDAVRAYTRGLGELLESLDADGMFDREAAELVLTCGGSGRQGGTLGSRAGSRGGTEWFTKDRPPRLVLLSLAEAPSGRNRDQRAEPRRSDSAAFACAQPSSSGRPPC